MPVVSSSSPPDSHGVGSGSSEMCTQRTGASAPVLAGRELQAHLGDEAAYGEHQWRTIRSQASVSTERSTVSISSNSSVSAISGGDSWITGSPRSSARQIRPLLVQLARHEAAQQVLRLLVAEALLGLLVLDQLERVEVAGAAHVADDRQVLLEPLEHPAELGLLLAHVAAEVLALEDVEVRHRDRRRHRVPAEGDPVGEHLRVVHERLGDAVGHDHARPSARTPR